MIVSCPSCGTHYKRPEAAPEASRARCGRCDASVDLRRLRPYRILTVRGPADPEAAAPAARLPIGLDEPGLAAAVAGGGAASVRGTAMTWRIEAPEAPEAAAPRIPAAADADTWDETDPLPPIPEMSFDPALDAVALPRVREADRLDTGGEEAGGAALQAEPESPTGVFAYLMWALGGAILGTGASWTLGGTTSMGLLVGGGTGLTAAWGWLRWTSRP